MSAPLSPSRSAVFSALAAFGLWAVLPVYWKAIAHLGSDLAVTQRVVWTMAIVVPLLMLRGEWVAWKGALRDRHVRRTHLLAGGLLAVNWVVFVWAAQHGHIVDASLGYFINPLFNVLIGRIWLGERLTRLQAWSIGCAAVGVAVQLILVGRVPWIGLLLAVTFGWYGLVRRQSPLGSLAGLGVETLLWLPVAVGYLIWQGVAGVALWGTGSASDLLLIFGLGVVTAAPLLGFAHAARNLPFAVLGVLQFLAPTGQFLLGALLYGEVLSPGRWLSFALIWVGVLLFCGDLLRGRARQ